MTQPLHILVVDDDEIDRKVITRQLAKTALDVITQETDSAELGLKLLQEGTVDCILLDYRMPEMTGIDFLKALHDQVGSARPAVVMMTGIGNERLVVQAMRLGVQDYLVKGEIHPEGLEEAVLHAIETTRLRKAEEAESQRLEELAMVDSLTRIGNRNFFNMRLEHALNRARRQGERVGLLYMDLNRFKEINDTLGHAAGDEVLCEVARRLTETARDSDTVVRLGGDEFAIVIETGVTDPGSRRLAMRINESLTRPITIGDQSVNIGVSIGIACFPEDAEGFGPLVHAADTAMYEAKYGKPVDATTTRHSGQR